MKFVIVDCSPFRGCEWRSEFVNSLYEKLMKESTEKFALNVLFRGSLHEKVARYLEKFPDAVPVPAWFKAENGRALVRGVIIEVQENEKILDRLYGP